MLVFASQAQRLVQLRPAWAHLHRPEKPFLQPQWTSSAHDLAASGNVVHRDWCISPPRSSPVSKAREDLLSNIALTPHMATLVGSTSDVLLKGSLWRWYTLQLPSFLCEEMFPGFNHLWMNYKTVDCNMNNINETMVLFNIVGNTLVIICRCVQWNP